MCKILRHSLLPVLVLTALLVFAPMAEAVPTLISPVGSAAKYETTVSSPFAYTVVITNNYGSSDSVEITLNAPATTNVVFWVYMPGEPDKNAQLGAVTIKKGATTGRLGVSASKFGDFTAGYVNVTTGGGIMVQCEYGISAKTALSDADIEDSDVDIEDYVKLRNSPSGAELLIVDGSIVTKGMVAYAVVNGKLYKATASKDGVELQVPLAANMEVGAPVWFTVAAAGCMEVDYTKLTLEEVETTEISDDTEFKLFFQGNGTSTSSLLLLNVNPGDTVRCTSSDGTVRKSATVPVGATMVTVGGMKLTAGTQLFVTITEKGKLESDPETIVVPGVAVPTALKSTAVSSVNFTGIGATITVKNVTEGDTVNIYDAKGAVLAPSKTAQEDDDPLDPDADNDTATVVFDTLNMGTTSSTIYLSVSSPGNGESAWLKYTVPAAKAAPPTP